VMPANHEGASPLSEGSGARLGTWPGCAVYNLNALVSLKNSARGRREFRSLTKSFRTLSRCRIPWYLPLRQAGGGLASITRVWPAFG
jgi:hypothetical protein